VNNQPNRTLDRFGAAAGVVAVILFIVIVTTTQAPKPPNRSIAEIARSAGENSDAILRGAYVGVLFSGALLLFGASMAARLQRAEGGGGWWIVALAGIAGSAVGVVSDALVVTFVRAVGHGVRGEQLWTGYPSGPDGVLVAIPLAVFLLGAGLGARASGALPRWLAWLGVALAAAFAVGAGGVMGNEVDGGILGGVLVLAYAGLLVWVAGSSVVMLRRPTLLRTASAGALG
jgi:hypothetical protein